MDLDPRQVKLLTAAAEGAHSAVLTAALADLALYGLVHRPAPRAQWQLTQAGRRALDTRAVPVLLVPFRDIKAPVEGRLMVKRPGHPLAGIAPGQFRPTVNGRSTMTFSGLPACHIDSLILSGGDGSVLGSLDLDHETGPHGRAVIEARIDFPRSLVVFTEGDRL